MFNVSVCGYLTACVIVCTRYRQYLFHSTLCAISFSLVYLFVYMNEMVPCLHRSFDSPVKLECFLFAIYNRHNRKILIIVFWTKISRNNPRYVEYTVYNDVDILHHHLSNIEWDNKFDFQFLVQLNSKTEWVGANCLWFRVIWIDRSLVKFQY